LFRAKLIFHGFKAPGAARPCLSEFCIYGGQWKKGTPRSGS
jgi:hypothetical protein